MCKAQEGTGSIRFGVIAIGVITVGIMFTISSSIIIIFSPVVVALKTLLFRKEPVRFGSENYGSRLDAVRSAFFGRVVARSDSVRFGSACGCRRFQNETVRFGSVEPVRFGFLFLPVERHAVC